MNDVLPPKSRPAADAIGRLVSLVEGPTAVFGADGALRAANAAFGTLVQGGAIGGLAERLLALAPSAMGAWRGVTVRGAIASGGRKFDCRVSPLDLAGAPLFLIEVQGTGLDGVQTRQLLDRLDLGFWDLDLSTGAFVATDAWHRLRGLDPEQPVDVAGETWIEAIHPDDRSAVQAVVDVQRRGTKRNVGIQYRLWRTGRGWVWILSRANILDVDEAGDARRIIGVDTEISDLKLKEAEAVHLAGKLRLANEVAGLGIWEFDEQTSTVHWDDRMLEIYGIDDGMNVRGGDYWESRLHPDDRDELTAYAAECQRENRDFMRDYRIVRQDGETRHIRSLARQVGMPPHATKLIGVNIDVTDHYRRAQELEDARRRLEYDSLHDPLTGLGNRRQLDDLCGPLFARAGPDHPCTIVLIDLDHFKGLNDTHGHAAGDAGLVSAARAIRASLPDAGRAFRAGGDEFVVLIAPSSDDAWVGEVCERIVAAIAAPFRFEGRVCRVWASIGYATIDAPSEKVTDVFAMADKALYDAKARGRGCVRACHAAD